MKMIRNYLQNHYKYTNVDAELIDNDKLNDNLNFSVKPNIDNISHKQNL